MRKSGSNRARTPTSSAGAFALALRRAMKRQGTAVVAACVMLAGCGGTPEVNLAPEPQGRDAGHQGRDAGERDVMVDVDAAEDAACPAGQIVCNTHCIDATSDPANCGSCLHQCSLGMLCSAGLCVVACGSGGTNCGGSCVNTQSDNENCGACAHQCLLGEVCSEGECVLSCGGGTTKCGESCVDTDVDQLNCGACSHSCAANETCVQGLCTLICGPTETRCTSGSGPETSDVCVNTQVDSLHCGTCDHACELSELCIVGDCVPTCSGAEVLCNTTCVDPLANQEYCGASADCLGDNAGSACPPNELCVQGTCAVTCADGQTACPAGHKCIEGVCEACETTLGFDTPRIIPVVKQARAVATGDFNNDGRPDIVAAGSQIGSSLTVLQGDGDGTFGEHTYDSGMRATSLALDDVDLDGNLDVIMANESEIGVLRGAGDGSFGTALVHAMGTIEGHLAVGDLNNDAKPDAVVANTDASVGVMLGGGDGAFAQPVAYSTGSAPSAVITGDVNGDGTIDVITAGSSSDMVSVLLGEGDGSLSAPSDYQAGFGVVRALFMADLNADGYTDLLVGGYALAVLPGVGDGTLGPVQTHDVGADASAIAVHDLDGDGNLDVITGNRIRHTAWVMFGDGTGGFVREVYYGVGDSLYSLATADFNLDGAMDLVTASGNDSHVNLLLGGSNGTFAGPTEHWAGAINDHVIGAVADFNGDLVPDLRVAHGTLLGMGDGRSFVDVPDYVTLSMDDVAVGDLNNDDLLDLVGVGTNEAARLGNGDGTFGPRLYLPSQAFTVELADVDQDGTLDLLHAGTSVRVLQGNGNGTFGTETTFASGSYPRFLTVADVNNDGRDDLLAADYTDINVFLALPGGGLAPPNGYSFPTHRGALAVGDFNGDGNPDLATDDNGARVRLGDGDGTFGADATYPLGIVGRGIVAADFDVDGNLDLATITPNENLVGIMLGAGDGTFSPAVTFVVGWYPSELVASDFNLDGRPDLAVARGHYVQIVLNSSTCECSP